MADIFSRAQDERELRQEIWLLAVQEAYIAKDGPRRDYLVENPEIRRWVDRNIQAGTCAAAIVELREKKERFRQARLEQLR